jgi:hypothetical protein
MCLLFVIVGLLIATVVYFPRVAQVVGAVILILLVITVAMATAEERPRRPCWPGYERSPSSNLCVPKCPPCMKTRDA